MLIEVIPSVVLHCVSPAAHYVATSKVTVIFTGRGKRDKKAFFVVQMFLIANMRTLRGSKLALVPSRKMSISSLNCAFFLLIIHEKYVSRIKQSG